jgi:hypothetical protein
MNRKPAGRSCTHPTQLHTYVQHTFRFVLEFRIILYIKQINTLNRCATASQYNPHHQLVRGFLFEHVEANNIIKPNDQFGRFDCNGTIYHLRNQHENAWWSALNSDKQSKATQAIGGTDNTTS